MSAVSHVDTTGLHQLMSLVQNCQAMLILVWLANPSRPLVALLSRNDDAVKIGQDALFASIHDAVISCIETFLMKEDDSIRPTNVISSP